MGQSRTRKQPPRGPLRRLRTPAVGRDTGDIQPRMSKADWSDFNEADDYSRTASTAYADAPAIPAYTGAALAWGAPPAA